MCMKTTRVGVVTGVIGGILQLSKIADKFPYPLNYVGYTAIFVGIFLIAFDVMHGGLED